jgi:hypothetical protein
MDKRTDVVKSGWIGSGQIGSGHIGSSPIGSDRVGSHWVGQVTLGRVTIGEGHIRTRKISSGHKTSLNCFFNFPFSDLSPERSPFSPITSVHLQNALHLRDLPQDDPIAQMLRQMPENLALSSSEVMKGRPPQTSTHQPALFRFPLPNQRAKKPQTIQQTGVLTEN